MGIVLRRSNEGNIDIFGNEYEIEDIIGVIEINICPRCDSENNISIGADVGYDCIRHQCLESKAIFEIGWSPL